MGSSTAYMYVYTGNNMCIHIHYTCIRIKWSGKYHSRVSSFPVLLATLSLSLSLFVAIEEHSCPSDIFHCEFHSGLYNTYINTYTSVLWVCVDYDMYFDRFPNVKFDFVRIVNRIYVVVVRSNLRDRSHGQINSHPADGVIRKQMIFTIVIIIVLYCIIKALTRRWPFKFYDSIKTRVLKQNVINKLVHF